MNFQANYTFPPGGHVSMDYQNSKQETATKSFESESYFLPVSVDIRRNPCYKKELPSRKN
jgi:hypothetical protein